MSLFYYDNSGESAGGQSPPFCTVSHLSKGIPFTERAIRIERGPGGKRSDIDSCDLIQSVPEPRSRGCAGVRPSTSGFFFGDHFRLLFRRPFWLFGSSSGPAGNAQTLIPGISYSPYRIPK